MAVLSKVIVILSVGFSALVLFRTLSRAAREVRVRPGLEWARVGVGIGGVAVMGAIVGTHTQPLFAIGALAGGAAIGYFQGQQTIVAIRESQLWAQRSLWGVILFSAGLIGMQLAGLGTRTGVFRFGQAISLFSIAVGMGVIAGRSGPSRQARRAARPLTTIVLILFIAGAGTALPAPGVLTNHVPGVNISLAAAQDEEEPPLPWVFEGTGTYHVERSLDFGAQGQDVIDLEIDLTVTFNADGSIEYLSIPVEVLPTRALANCTTGEFTILPNDRGPALNTYSGSHANGAFTVVTPGTLTFGGTYSASEMSGGYEVSGSSSCDGAGSESFVITVSFSIPRVLPVIAVPQPTTAPTTAPPETTPDPTTPQDTVAPTSAPQPEDAGGELARDGEDLADGETISDEEAIAAGIAGAFVALLISGLTLAEAGLALTDLFGDAGREFAGSMGAFDGTGGFGSMPPPSGSPSGGDGPVSVESNSPDGSSRRVDWDSDGSRTETITAPDGTTTATPRDPSGQEFGSGPTRSIGQVPSGGVSGADGGGIPWHGGGSDTAPAPVAEPAPVVEPAVDSGRVPYDESRINDDVADWLDDAPLGGQAPPLEGQWVDGTPTRLTDNDGDGVFDRVQADTDRDGVFDEPWSGRPEQESVSSESMLPDGSNDGGSPGLSDSSNPSDVDPFGSADVPVDTDDVSGQPDSVEPIEVPAVDPSGLTEVTQREIDDIYERGLSVGRSLDDLREDVAGLNESRGGSGDVGNPYGLEMVPTDAGPVPLTPQELAAYRAAQNELGALSRQRDELMQDWQHQDSRFQQWRQRNPIQNAEDVWNNETRWQRNIAEQNEWISTWNDWLKGETLRRAPDGSTYNEQFGHINDPDWHSGDNDAFAHERIRHHRNVCDRYERARHRDIERAARRPSAADELAVIDKAKEDIFARRRAVASQQERANATLDRFRSYATGRPLPSP